MDCTTAEELVAAYVNRSLAPQELAGFLEHIELCEDCYDELETYFIAHEAMRLLNEDKDSDLDFRRRLEADIRRAHRLVSRRRIYRALRLATVLVVLGVLLVVGFLYFSS